MSSRRRFLRFLRGDPNRLVPRWIACGAVCAAVTAGLTLIPCLLFGTWLGRVLAWEAFAWDDLRVVRMRSFGLDWLNVATDLSSVPADVLAEDRKHASDVPALAQEVRAAARPPRPDHWEGAPVYGVLRAGFPWKSLVGVTVPAISSAGPVYQRHGIVVVRGIEIPVVPEIGPFVGNFVVCSLPICCVWAGAVLVRRQRRFRRGECPRCEYPVVTGSHYLRTCPECGEDIDRFVRSG